MLSGRARMGMKEHEVFAVSWARPSSRVTETFMQEKMRRLEVPTNAPPAQQHRRVERRHISSEIGDFSRIHKMNECVKNQELQNSHAKKL